MDMDGVVTSELGYWRAAALTVYELLYDYRLYGKQDIDREWCCRNVEWIYDIIFRDEKTIATIKNLGVNTNWDLAYVTFLVSTYINPEQERLERDHFDAVGLFFDNMEMKAPELYDALEKLAETAKPRGEGYYKRTTGPFWKQLNDCFQRWFHGDEEVPGIKERECPLLDLEQIKTTLQFLRDQGYSLGIGTGRPVDEIEFPLKMWGLDGYFDLKPWSTFNDIVAAEERIKPDTTLVKPHPFVFQRAAFGDTFTDEEICAGAVTKEMASRCLVVGDAASDMMAAQAGGFKFAAVLTGVTGEAGRAFFEEHHADMILNSVLDFPDICEQ